MSQLRFTSSEDRFQNTVFLQKNVFFPFFDFEWKSFVFGKKQLRKDRHICILRDHKDVLKNFFWKTFVGSHHIRNLSKKFLKLWFKIFGKFKFSKTVIYVSRGSFSREGFLGKTRTSFFFLGFPVYKFLVYKKLVFKWEWGFPKCIQVYHSVKKYVIKVSLLEHGF